MKSKQENKKKQTKVTMLSAFKTIIWPRRNLVFIGLILIILSRLSSLVLPWKSKELLDEIIPNKDMSGLYNLLWLVGFAVLINPNLKRASTISYIRIACSGSEKSSFLTH
jgi:ABC-type bacteriocin/lantibiotic exporter with double-glycine peptidase domain